jgi:KaiC/GvpD/RAD55 family RecA-like ATPase
LSERIATGISGLDDLVGGGFPKGRAVLVIGGPGTGKTIMCAQFLYKGIYEHEESGVFVSLDESKDHFYAEMQQFGWDFRKAEEEGKFSFIDATRMSRLAILEEKLDKEGRSLHARLRGKRLPIDELIKDLQVKVYHTKIKPHAFTRTQRVAVDTLAALIYRIPDPTERRTAVVDIIESLSDLGVTSLVTTELGYLGLERNVLEEEFLVHGVIMMQTLFSGGTTTRAIQVEKMREAKVNPNLVPYSIDQNGIEVFPNMPLFGEK